MSREFPNNDTNPETNAFKWLYYSIKDLSKIMLPRFWKLIVLLTALSLFGRISGIICAKISDVLFSLPERIVSNVHRGRVAPQAQAHSLDFTFNIFSQTFGFSGNLILFILALISAFFMFSPSRITADDKNAKGFRWLFLFFFLVFLSSFFVGSYSHIRFHSLAKNAHELMIFSWASGLISILLHSINMPLSILIIFGLMKDQKIQFITVIDKIRKHQRIQHCCQQAQLHQTLENFEQQFFRKESFYAFNRIQL